MIRFQTEEAFGSPGIEPRWTNGAKEGVGTAYAASARIWFTLWNGVMTEVYYPTIDLPQIRDLQLLFSDGKSFLHEEKRDFTNKIERIEPGLGYRLVNTHTSNSYRVVKEVITDPHLACVLMNVRVEGEPAFLENLNIYALCAPHLNGGGSGNTALVRQVAGKTILCAHKIGGGLTDAQTWLALGADVPFGKTSVGFVGQSDGWTDLNGDFSLDWHFQKATDGNVALCGEILAPLEEGVREFTLTLAFGSGQHSADTTLLQSLSTPFHFHRDRFYLQWQRPQRHLQSELNAQSGDDGKLLRSSYNVLLAHEDKRFPGALIASLSIPWGEAKNDEDTGGYHLVWPRDMVNSAMGLIAAGQVETASRALIYLAASQFENGSFAQNFWIDGKPYWLGLQLDEVAFPLLLARKLQELGAIQGFDPLALVTRAARFLVLNGPVTAQERWEEASGLSPSTLAAVIAGLLSASGFLRAMGDETSSQFLDDYADWLEGNLDGWCATEQGELLEGEPHHYVRINPLQPGDFLPESPPLDEEFELTSQEPDTNARRRAREVFDGGFLELVRYGIRRADDPLVVSSVQVMDAILKADTPRGSCFFRYNGDGYGQRDDGNPYHSHWGVGRPWPLLGGERGHYEVALGREKGGNPDPWIWSLEGFASGAGLLPEQIWNAPDLPEKHLETGRSTGAARPLAWAHAEYIKLLRSKRDGYVFDVVCEASERYVEDKFTPRRDLLVWGANFPSKTIASDAVLRLTRGDAFTVRWTSDNWKTRHDNSSDATPMGVHFYDLPAPKAGQKLEWTFFSRETLEWDGKNHDIEGR